MFESLAAIRRKVSKAVVHHQRPRATRALAALREHLGDGQRDRGLLGHHEHAAVGVRDVDVVAHVRGRVQRLVW